MASSPIRGKFIIETDQKSLQELMNQVIQTLDQHYYFSKLLGYDCTISCEPGKNSKGPDALSQKDHSDLK